MKHLNAMLFLSSGPNLYPTKLKVKAMDTLQPTTTTVVNLIYVIPTLNECTYPPNVYILLVFAPCLLP